MGGGYFSPSPAPPPMNAKPIGPRTHGAIDYVFAAANSLAPTLFNFRGRARALSYAFASSQGLLNAFTDQPLAVRRVVPFSLHGRLETFFVPALVVLPWLAGALKQRAARRYFLAFFGIALTHYLLTDYRHDERRPAAAPAS